VPFVIPALGSGALILAVGFWVIPTHGVLGIVMAKFFIQFLVNNWFAPYLSLKLLKWPLHRYLYQFPYYGFSFLSGLVKDNLLKRIKN
jgi:hypothetical protein